MIPVGQLTDGEIKTELQTASAGRREELKAEIARRRDLRASLRGYDPTLSHA